MPELPRRWIVFIALFSMACGGARSAPPATAPPPIASPAAAAPPARDPDAIRWVRDAAEYRAAVMQVYRQATARVEAEAAARKAGTWAVVLDADETVISNLTYQVERSRAGLAYSPESWREWVSRRAATPLPGAAAFLARVHDLGGRIAIVTNRRQSECEDTIAVFRLHALQYDAVLCRSDGGPSDKNPRFEAVAAGQTTAGAGPLAVVAFVGDNILDFPQASQASARENAASLDAFGVRFFVIPNPMYGSWQ
ncbi:MAG TPA: HAD family acid phosphatase [Steroidobacteraceae bacterium]